MKRSLNLLIVTAFVVWFSMLPLSKSNAQVVVCTDLKYDLYLGLSDSGGDNSVRKLQNYLYNKGYLVISPTGYYGAGTISAIKKLQGANKISQTGRAGPATRTAIRNASCITGTPVTTSNQPVYTSSSGSTNSNTSHTTSGGSSSQTANVSSYGVVDTTAMTISQPEAGSTLVTDTKYRIGWAEQNGGVYALDLEDKYGVGAGHIVGAVTGSHYDWKVGKTFSSKTNTESYVEPGTYRIHLTSAGITRSVKEQYSGLFNILEKSLTLSVINPSTVPNDDNSSVVLYGSGFRPSSLIHFDVSSEDDRTVKPQYISRDGKILVFTVPSNIYPSQYSIVVNNTYESGATSTPSNSINLNVISN